MMPDIFLLHFLSLAYSPPFALHFHFVFIFSLRYFVSLFMTGLRFYCILLFHEYFHYFCHYFHFLRVFDCFSFIFFFFFLLLLIFSATFFAIIADTARSFLHFLSPFLHFLLSHISILSLFRFLLHFLIAFFR
jgi:hypothetical protein